MENDLQLHGLITSLVFHSWKLPWQPWQRSRDGVKDRQKGVVLLNSSYISVLTAILQRPVLAGWSLEPSKDTECGSLSLNASESISGIFSAAIFIELFVRLTLWRRYLPFSKTWFSYPINPHASCGRNHISAMSSLPWHQLMEDQSDSLAQESRAEIKVSVGLVSWTEEIEFY